MEGWPHRKTEVGRGGRAGLRHEIGRKGALTRWVNAGKVPKIGQAVYGAPDKPLRLGEIEIPAYVLADERRVFSQRGLQAALGLSTGGGKGGARKIAEFMDKLAAKGIDTKDIAVRANNAIKFIPPGGGNPASGYEVTILEDICAVVIEAYQRGALDARQAHVGERCMILQRGFARVGINHLGWPSLAVSTGPREPKFNIWEYRPHKRK